MPRRPPNPHRAAHAPNPDLSFQRWTAASERRFVEEAGDTLEVVARQVNFPLSAGRRAALEQGGIDSACMPSEKERVPDEQPAPCWHRRHESGGPGFPLVDELCLDQCGRADPSWNVYIPRPSNRHEIRQHNRHESLCDLAFWGFIDMPPTCSCHESTFVNVSPRLSRHFVDVSRRLNTTGSL